QFRDQLRHLARRFSRLRRERPYLVRDHRETLTVLLRPRRLDRRIEREQVRLPRDPGDGLGEHADPLRHARQPGHRRGRGSDLLANRAERLARARHPLPAPLRRGDQACRVRLHQLRADAQRFRLVGGFGALAARSLRHLALLPEIRRQPLRRVGDGLRGGMELFGRSGELLRERRHFVGLAPGSYSTLCRKLEPRYAIAPVSTRKLPTAWPWSNAYGRTAMKNAATKPPRPNHTTRTATRRTSNSDSAYTSHQRYQPRSWMSPRSSFTNAAPPATSTIVVGRVFTAPNPHPTRPSANPNATITRRSRCVREIVSRSLRRCSRPVASSFQPRTSEARDGRDDSVGSVLTRG